MRGFIQIVALLSTFSFVAPAYAAPSLGGIRLEQEGDDVAVRVLADAPLENARVRTERGRIRVWFRDVLNQPRIVIDGDGRAVSQVGLFPGMEETVLLRVDLGHSVRVRVSDVRIEPTEDGCLVHVPTGWLPPVEPAPSAAGEPAASEEATPEDAAESESTEDTAAATASATPSASASSSATSAASATSSLGARADRESPALGTREPTSLPILPLAGLALALGLAWFFAQKKRSGGGQRSEIQVLATHRLGPKHQLLVVRALGQDHLLAVHGQNTKVLGTTKPTEERQASTFLARLREVADERSAPPAPAPPSQEAEDRFGARLLSLVGGRETPPPEVDPSMAHDPVAHDSVAGLLRLKARQSGG